ncbi:replication initiation factor domain-containing protein [Sandaracinobacter neustonicus]|uniref:Replication initiation factor domain-containing protein n=1 Tax=Sandaracinobacter neustonicus TaxID=1715348 RepID=A0A501XFV4_9SPHN|nr:replication initiation factor domain-containing protein [Sandaracinobacter neustonicus]TPE59416.1 replication initiation factor domain-containing protein [Sandaracinobacter neustonicus]
MTPDQLAECRFVGSSVDWLDVRVRSDFFEARDKLLDALGGEVARSKLEAFDPPNRMGYEFGVKVTSAPAVGSLSLVGGHRAARGWSMFSGSQRCADWLWRFLRVESTDVLAQGRLHQVNRVDAAFDFMYSGPPELLFRHGLSMCAEYDLANYREGRPGRGETLYMGWEKKPACERKRTNSAPIYAARLYQKGYEQGAGIGAIGISPDWWRFEVMLRPDKPASKERAFMLSVDQIGDGTRWTRAFLNSLGYEFSERKPHAISSPVEAVAVGKRAVAVKNLRSLSHMTDQYAAAAQSLAELVGWDRVETIVMDALRETREGRKPGDGLRRLADDIWTDDHAPEFRELRDTTH